MNDRPDQTLETTSPLVSIAVLNYNGVALMQRFLPSVAALDYPNCEFMGVDGGSTDGSLEFLARFPKFRIIRQERKGTADAMNQAVPNSSGKYIIWLANDMEVKPNLVKLLVGVLESDSTIGVCGCSTVRMTEDGRKLGVVDQFGFSVDKFGVPSYRLSGLPTEVLNRMSKPEDAFFCGGDHMMIRRDLLRVTGLYDPDYFSLNEDEDLCWRVWLSGHRVVVHPQAIAYHVLSATMRKYGRRKIRFHSEKNMLSNLIKNYEPSTLFVILPQYFGLLLTEVLFLCFVGRIDLAQAEIGGVLWVLRNLRKIWSRHIAVSNLRRVDDRFIMRLMSSRPYKITIHLRSVMRDRSTL